MKRSLRDSPEMDRLEEILRGLPPERREILVDDLNDGEFPPERMVDDEIETDRPEN